MAAVNRLIFWANASAKLRRGRTLRTVVKQAPASEGHVPRFDPRHSFQGDQDVSSRIAINTLLPRANPQWLEVASALPISLGGHGCSIRSNQSKLGRPLSPGVNSGHSREVCLPGPHGETRKERRWNRIQLRVRTSHFRIFSERITILRSRTFLVMRHVFGHHHSHTDHLDETTLWSTKDLRYLAIESTYHRYGADWWVSFRRADSLGEPGVRSPLGRPRCPDHLARGIRNQERHYITIEKVVCPKLLEMSLHIRLQLFRTHCRR